MANGMRVMVVGKGGREHALVWRIRQSPLVERVFATQENAGIGMEPKVTSIFLPDDQASIVAVAKARRVDLVVIGPDEYIVNGLTDACDDAGLLVFGPRRRAAQLEGSKSFAKKLMADTGIPTAPGQWFDSFEPAAKFLATHPLPVVIKTDGLQYGKGVDIADTREAAYGIAARRIREGRIVIEEFLFGEEASYTCIVAGGMAFPWPGSQDHKHAFDGDRGPMTGGMGAYSPTPVLDRDMCAKIMERIIVPLLRALEVEMISYTGFLYIGLMIVRGEPFVLEFNCRLGDPEAQALLMRFTGDFAMLLYDAARNQFSALRAEWDPRPALCLVLAADGYPGKSRTGDIITGLETAAALEGVKVFHAGIELRSGQIVTRGGRILGVTAMGEKLSEARDRAYRAAEEIQFEGKYYRRDIGHRGIARERETKART